jgi:uncharacterized protein
MRLLKRLLALILLAVVSTYLLVGALLYVYQAPLLFPAPQVDARERGRLAEANGATELVLTGGGETLYGWHVPGEGKRAFLYFHGNGESVAWSRFAIELARPHGYDVVVIEYPGYPGSSGEPTEAGLHASADAAWAFTTDELGIPADRIVLYGMSLGGGVATQLAAREHPAGLILDSTFSSLPDEVFALYPMYPSSLLLAYEFDSVGAAPLVSSRALVMHSANDDLIPVRLGRRLHDALPNSQWIEVHGLGHGGGVSSVPEARSAINEVLASVPRGL